jgi:hypothetical protein
MGSITNFLEVELLDHVLNQATYSAPSNLYLVLCTADPTDAATGASCNETPDSGGYQRTEITFAVAASRSVDQDADCQFPQATADWSSTITHWCIADTQTYGSGNILAHGAFATGKDIKNGDTPKVASGEIDVTFSAGEISNFLANELLDHVFNNAAWTPTDTYVALCTATVADDDTGSTITEPSGNGYARELVDENGGTSPTWDLAVSGDPSYVDNGADVDLGPASGGSWGTIAAVAIVTASSAGEVLLYDNDMTDKPVGDGDTARFAAGDLDMQMS